MALALKDRAGSKLTTVDIRDVNSGDYYNKNGQRSDLKTPLQIQDRPQQAMDF